jgi:hypothetical protein
MGSFSGLSFSSYHVKADHGSSHRTFADTSSWPEVLEGKELAFPNFHPDILQKPTWDAAEQRGRIRIVIAEGLLLHGAFNRLRDVLAFSYQHAPLREYA